MSAVPGMEFCQQHHCWHTPRNGCPACAAIQPDEWADAMTRLRQAVNDRQAMRVKYNLERIERQRLQKVAARYANALQVVRELARSGDTDNIRVVVERELGAERDRC